MNITSQVKHLWPKTVIQAFLIILIAAGIGLGLNHFRKENLPVLGNWKPQVQSTGDTLSIDQAKKLFLSHEAVFVDARPRNLYEQGHIQGAFSLPVEAFDQYFFEFLKATPAKTRIITYCDGESCSLSHELVKMLRDQGYTNLQVLSNGWTLWQQNQLPVERGN